MTQTDTTPRYAPDTVITTNGRESVVSKRAYPAGQHPKGCPLVPYVTAVELKTMSGKSRWYGCEKAWLNSELRLLVQGFPAQFEEMAKWTKAKHLR